MTAAEIARGRELLDIANATPHDIELDVRLMHHDHRAWMAWVMSNAPALLAAAEREAGLREALAELVACCDTVLDVCGDDPARRHQWDRRNLNAWAAARRALAGES